MISMANIRCAMKLVTWLNRRHPSSAADGNLTTGGTDYASKVCRGSDKNNC